MSTTVNRRWVFVRYPEGIPPLDTWRLEEAPMPEPAFGQILVKAHWLSVDPYMRARMSQARNYAQGVSPGDVMTGAGVGEVVESKHPAWKKGDIAESMQFGWQEWSVLAPGSPGSSGVNRVDPNLAPIESSLFWLGMPGLTAYFGLLDVGRPRPGDTVVVSAAAGAVGQLVGQIANLAGCRAIAIASDDAKLAWCREIGFAAAINYRTAQDLGAAIEAACPSGVDVFFDNTGGPIQDTVIKRLAVGARIIVCGRIALAGQFGKPDIGERLLSDLLVTRSSAHGFLVMDWWHRRDEALRRLAGWHREGRIKARQDVMEGIESMPEAFLRLVNGKNFGKQLVKIL